MANEMTHEGYRILREELDQLKTIGRDEIAARIKEARSFGDLSENAEYDEAMNAQAIMEARITTIEAILKTAVIIDESNTNTEHVHLTSVVTIENLNTGKQSKYKIVGSGSNEANPREGKISDESPIGMALMDKSVGDVVEVETPGGVVALKVIEISK